MSVTQISKTKKKGGPYNKKKQEERKNQVYELYFEKGESALKIADQLGVNRNTISQDIKFCYQHIASCIGKNDLGGLLIKQIERLDIQRKRLLYELDNESDLDVRLKIEKFLFEIDQKLAGFATKMGQGRISLDFDAKEFTDEEVCSIVRSLAFSCGIMYPETVDEERIQQKVIALCKCNIGFAQNILNKLRELGLDLFESISSKGYDLFEFGIARGYITQKKRRFSILAILVICFGLANIPYSFAIDTCGLDIYDSSIFYNDLQEGQTSSEQTFLLSNPGTVNATLSINATDWVDATQTSVINVANTGFSLNSFLEVLEITQIEFN